MDRGRGGGRKRWIEGEEEGERGAGSISLDRCTPFSPVTVLKEMYFL